MGHPAQAVLETVAALPVTRWNYRVDDAAVTHIGPVAEDFHKAFATGQEDQYLAALDTAGVAPAAIQGLHEIVQEKDCKITNLESEISNLKSEIAELKATVGGATTSKNGGAQ